MNLRQSFRLSNKTILLHIFSWICTGCSSLIGEQQKLLCPGTIVLIKIPANWVRARNSDNHLIDSNNCTFFFGRKLARGVFLSTQTYKAQAPPLNLKNEIISTRVKHKNTFIIDSLITSDSKNVTLNYLGYFYEKKDYYFKSLIINKNNKRVFVNFMGPNSEAFQDTVSSIVQSIEIVDGP